MELASIINQYYDAFMIKYGDTALPGHLKAMNAIRRCRTPDSGELYVQCPDCHHAEWRPLSCGHRSCPKCQNHEASKWIDRQQAKLLPVLYFLATFTLPFELSVIDLAPSESDLFPLIHLCFQYPEGFWLESKKFGGRNRYDYGIAY